MRWLLWLYPPRWRRRYADELLALLEERGASIGLLLDVLVGAVDAWLHPDLAAPQAVAAVATSAPRRRAGRFDLFTQSSRTVLRLAQEAAQDRQHAQIGPQHLLLGLLLEGDGVAAHVLRQRAGDPSGLRGLLEARLASAPTADSAQPLGLSLEAKRVIERSVAEANRLHHRYLGPEHLLLGLAAEPGSGVTDLLHVHDQSDLVALRRTVKAVLSRPNPPGSPDSPQDG
jgi:ATP-dependent Clp protease ATP-binding subunit ClpC